jgi:hypothetical protein
MREAETAEAIALCKYMELRHSKIFDHMFHVPNGGLRNKTVAAKLKAQGAKAGVSDYFIAIPVGRYHGLWLELKAGKNGLTPTQKEWLRRMTIQNYACVAAWGWEAAAQCIEQYINGQVDRIILEDLVEQ